MSNLENNYFRKADTGVRRPVPDKSSKPRFTLEPGDLVRHKEYCINLRFNKNSSQLKQILVLAKIEFICTSWSEETISLLKLLIVGEFS